MTDMHWLLTHADDYVQMLFDMDRHGIQPLTENCIKEAERFERLAKEHNFKSKYHPRLKEQANQHPDNRA